jgi:hypothetical protein
VGEVKKKPSTGEVRDTDKIAIGIPKQGYKKQQNKN